jgi:uncharacterized heparinase superfamily protein
VIEWETNAEFDYIVAEHDGYRRLTEPLTHRRSLRFEKAARYWLIEDSFTGAGTHEFAFRFHCAPGIDVQVSPDGNVQLCDKINGTCLLIAALTESAPPLLEPGFASANYGAKEASTIVCWLQRGSAPLRRWALIPSSGSEDERRVTRLVASLRAETGAKFPR